MSTQKNNKTQFKRPKHDDQRRDSFIEPVRKSKTELVFENLNLLMTGCMSLIIIICMMIYVCYNPDLRKTGFDVLKSALLLLIGYIAGGKSKN